MLLETEVDVRRLESLIELEDALVNGDELGEYAALCELGLDY